MASRSLASWGILTIKWYVKYRVIKERIEDFWLEKITKVTGNSLLEDFMQSTPVDTGEAAASWYLRVYRPYKMVRIQSDSTYMAALNAGFSKQAPAGFLENLALKRGRPRRGPILRYF